MTRHEPSALARTSGGLLATQFALWRQKRHAAAVSRELLKLRSSVAGRHPELKGRVLYRRIVMERCAIDTGSADRILMRAEQSFAAWPSARDLTFADVVHYLAIEEYLAAHGETHWTHADMGRTVAARIPAGL